MKVMATQSYGAEVVLHGANYDEACVHALALATERGLTFLHPFDDLDVIAGQGTIGLELLEQCPEARSGGGAHRRRRVDRRRGRCDQGNSTLGACDWRADGAAAFHVVRDDRGRSGDGAERFHDCRWHRGAARGGDHFPLAARYVDEIVSVEEEEIASAILTLLEREKLLAEGAGAAATAALLQRKTMLEGKHTAVLVCGGNIDVSLLSQIIERGLVKDGRRVRLRIYLPDRPGALVELSSVIASQKANIVEVKFDRAYYGVSLGDTAIDITLETRGAQHLAELLAAIARAGYTHERVL